MPEALPPTYLSGETIRPGDHVLYHGEEGKIEFVAMPDDPNTKWYVEQFGNGCMILTPGFGRVYVPQADADLQFISRDDHLQKT